MSRFARAMWRQAVHDLDVARRAQGAGDFDWAMLAAQQAAEKGLTAVLLISGLRAEQTHNVAGLLDALVAAGVATREQRASLNLPLARLTVAFGFARYPNAEIAEAPADIIVREQGEEAIRDAEAIVAAARAMASELDA
ncbi:HEPN domain-containing protein [Roseomonas sp. AR75]|uniref:HEPN domain-containing protein n=1 Tax=Roseomonas sp. AR75 TaxID=2562311 RepID=UPI0010C0927E|nr:HEPN domain-containing protein [Roseomonas sp. AR75]